MLNSESQIRCGPKMNDYFRLITLIKSKERGYKPKQGRTFTKKNIEAFLEEAPSTGLFCLEKAALINGLYGGLQGEEMANLRIENFSKDNDGNYWVEYNVSKQKQCEVSNRFHILKKTCNLHKTIHRMYKRI